MDLPAILARIEVNFFDRMKKKPWWSIPEIKKEFNEAIKDVLILTYSRVMKDAKGDSHDP